MVQVVGAGLEPGWPGEVAEARGLTGDIWQLMRNCWRRDPALRTQLEALRGEIAELTESATSSIAEFHFDNFKKKGTIRNFGKDISKGGWFDNNWIVDLSITSGAASGLVLPSAIRRDPWDEHPNRHRGRVIARTLKTGLDGSSVSSSNESILFAALSSNLFRTLNYMTLHIRGRS